MIQPEPNPGSERAIVTLMGARDWSMSALGHPASWSSELRIIVQVVLESRFPMFVVWGPEFGFLYNEPFVTMLDNKYPLVFGGRFQDMWGEIWPYICPLVTRAFAGEAVDAENLSLAIRRNGRNEQGFFTFSYSPIRDHTNKVVGLHCVVTETTAHVLANRRQAFLLEVADRLGELSDPHDIMTAASRLLGHQLNAGRVGYGAVDEVEGIVSVDRDWTNGGMKSLAGMSAPLNSSGAMILNQARRGNTLRIDDVATDERSAAHADGYVGVGVRSMLVIPLLEARRLRAILYVNEPSPRHWTDEEVVLTEEVARRIWEALRRTRTEAALRDDTWMFDLLNQTAVTTASTRDLHELLQSITDSSTQVSGAKFGAFFYNTIDAQGDALMLYTLSGAPREAFEKLGHPRPTPVFAPTFNGGPPIRSDDITTDARYGTWGPHGGMPAGHLPVRSYLAVSVMSRTGETIGGLFFGHPDTGVFTERTERIIAGIATQAGMAVDNARLYEAAQLAAQEREVLLSRERAGRIESERLNRMKDEFLAMLAHELRNPLAPISSAAELLGMLFTSEPKVQKISAIISRQVVHMTRLVDDLLDVSRVTRGLVTMHKVSINLRDMISNAIDQAQPLITERRHQLTVDLPAQAVHVDGDHVRLVQAVSNILTNAAKYTPEAGNIYVKASIINHQLQVSVEDDGCGMAPEFLPEVFELFSQGARTLARSQGGLGVGLALVKKLVELHDGMVEAYSDGLDRGSRFVITLPLATGKFLQEPKNPPIANAAAEDWRKVGRPKHIMVIDDNVDAADLLAAYLDSEGHSVAVAYSAQEALARVSEKVPAVFLIDIGLPDMDGYALATRLLALPETRQSLFVAVTGYGNARDRERAEAAGFAHHLVKPVNMTRLLSLITAAEVRLVPTR